MIRARPTLALLLALALLGPARTAAAAPDLALAYEAWQGGLYVMRIETDLRRGSAAYRIATTAETDGLIGWLFPYRLETRTRGRAGADGLAPRRFDVATREHGETKRRSILYRDDGALEVIRRPAEPPKADAPPASLLRGSVDPASALMTLAERFAADGRCTGRVAVFDGRRRYDLALADLGPARLGKSRYSLYAGPARRCRATVIRLAGFRRHGSSLGRVPDSIDVWLAPPLPGAPPLPVRLQGESSFGSLVIHLVAAQARSQITGTK